MSTNSNTNVYFPSLNGLRFIAAALVFVHHFANLNCVRATGFVMENSFLSAMGGTGVTLFFVLSGFLITYLLLAEQARKRTVNISNFYVRRLLRIWPLYFLTLLIYLCYGYFDNELSSSFFEIKLMLYVCFLPNVAHILLESGGFPSQLWSVGSEEQFYLMYPWLMKYLRKHIVLVLSMVIVLFIIGRVVLLHRIQHSEAILFKGINVLQFVFDFTNAFRIDCMATGGLFAWLLFNKHNYLQLLYAKKTQYVVYASIVLLVLTGFSNELAQHSIYSMLFGIVILNLSSNSNSVLSLENSFFNSLGKISYGLYVIHPFILTITNTYIQPAIVTSHLFSTIFISLCISFGLTVVFSYLLFTYFETPFLKFKNKFSIIPSGNDAK